MTPEAIEKAAAILAGARQNIYQIEVLPADCRPETLADAYAVQRRLVDCLGRETVGWFLGGTSLASRQSYGFPDPYWAPILDTAFHESPVTLQGNEFFSRGVDVEFGFRLSRDIGAGEAPCGMDWVADAVAAVHPVIDIFNSHFFDMRQAGWPSVIADVGTDGAIVLGSGVEDWRSHDLRAVKALLIVNGETVEHGAGWDVMDGPLESLRWLINARVREGGVFKVGEYVSTGSCTPAHFVDVGDHVVGELEGLGRVEVVFSL